MLPILIARKLTEEEPKYEFNPFIPITVVLILFVVSGFLSYQEFKYAMWGRTANAEIIKVKETAFSAEGGRGAMMEVHYRWTDKNDGERTDELLRNPWMKDAVGKTIKIDYLPGVKQSRIAGAPLYSKIAVGFFIGSGSVALLLFAYVWWRGARTKPARTAR
ncbi:MAG: hypothetical protein H6819_04475 [Phycisphaerales bacterium]|nr:hypothetical protein [Phycisphaerales bacterium]MCB9856455.1 hypothetical protein [Phycisphaerales bacterium]